MFDDLTDLYQQVILDHSKSPRNFRVLPDANRHAQGHNPVCGDNITLYLRMDGDRVADASFQGSGCAISKASSSILTETLKGKTKAEVKELFEKVRAMVTTGQTPEGDLGKLAVFTGVHKFPARVKCASLSWKTLEQALEGGGVATTEEGNGSHD